MPGAGISGTPRIRVVVGIWWARYRFETLVSRRRPFAIMEGRRRFKVFLMSRGLAPRRRGRGVRL